MNQRNWEALLLATLRRARDVLPGPGCTEESIDKMDSSLQGSARLGMDIDEILEMAEERADGLG